MPMALQGAGAFSTGNLKGNLGKWEANRSADQGIAEPLPRRFGTGLPST